MKLVLKWFAPLVLSAVLFSSGEVYAAFHPEAGPDPTEQHNETAAEEKMRHKMSRKCSMFRDHVHQRAYLTLLAEKYAPDTVKAWNAVLDESARLHEQYIKMFRSDEGKELRKSLKKKGFSDEMKARIKKHMEAKQRFTTAIRSSDPENIKAALAELLVHYKEHNEHLAEKLQE